MSFDSSGPAGSVAADAELLRWIKSGQHTAGGSLISSGYQGSAYLYAGPDGRCVVKSANGRGLLGWIRRRMIRREYSIYRRLSGVAGVPACYGLLDGQYLVLEYVEGMALSEVGQQLDDSEIFFARLLGIIQSMHEAGVAHADLKRRKNVLVTTDGQPCVIDFGTAVVTSEPDRWLNRRCFDLVKRFDYNAWIKLKYRRNYKSITPADQPYYQPTLIEGVMRVIRRIWGTITFRQLRKARRRARESRSGSSG